MTPNSETASALAPDRLASSVTKALLWLGTGTTIIQTVSWLSTILVMRLLSPGDYGLMAMTTVFTGFLTTLGEFGISAALVQARTLTEHDVRRVFGWVLLTGLAGWAVAYAAAPWAAAFYDAPDLVPLVRVGGLSVLAVMTFVVPQSLFIRAMNFKAKAQIDVLAQLTSVVVTLTCALNGLGVWSLIGGLLAMQVTKAIAYHVAHGRIVPLFALKETLPLLRYGAMVTGDRLLNFFYQETDKIVVGRVLGGAVLGTYNVALALALIPMEKALPIVTQVSFASYARIQNDMERVRRNVLRAARLIALAAFPMFFGMSAVAPMAIPLMLGEKWRAAIVPFQLICLVLPLRALGPILASALHGVGRPAVSLVNMVILTSVMSLAFLVGVRFGVEGVCLAWLCVYPFVLLITTARTLRVLEISMGVFLGELRFPFLASAAMLVVVQVVRRFVPESAPVVSLLCLAAAGASFYAFLVLTLHRQPYQELRNLLHR